MSVKNEEIFSISTHHCAELKKRYHQLGMPSTKGTDENKIYDSIIDIINKFNLEKKSFGFTCGGGVNLNKCSDIICYQLDRTAVFTPNKPLFEMECLTHVIDGACKAGVVDVQYEDGLLDTSSTRAKTNKAITWTNK